MPTTTPNAYPGVPGTTLYAGLPTPVPAAPNEMRVSLPSGSQTNYPLQFGRSFKQGVIAGEPQVSIGGTPMATQQADVKTRYDDGSVKFAVISVIIPSLTTSQITLTIGNKSATAGTPETRANMLANYNFDAKIDVKVAGTSVIGAPASARTMLTALSDATLAANTTTFGPNSRYWTQGPVCTTVILGDHTAKTYDLGVTADKTMRPVFYVEFWPTINRYKVRHVLEIADVTKLRGDTGLQVIFSTDNTSPVERLNQSGVSMAATTWESREYWGGADIPTANVDHNLAYLASVGVTPNYDTSIVLNEAALTSYETAYASMNKALGQNGTWTKAMGTTGGRPDLGLFNKHEILALYSGRAHMIERTIKHCEFAGSWPVYWREGASGRTYFGSTDGLGREVTIYGRVSQFLSQLDGQYTTSEDKFTYLPSAGDPNGWIADDAHSPSLFYVPYLMTGGAFWYDKMQQLAAWAMFFHQIAEGYNNLSRGDNNYRMLLNNTQTRGFAWMYRNRARAWWMALDGSPQKAILNKAMDDATAARCGIHGVDEFIGDPVREAWNTNYNVFFNSFNGTFQSRPNPLGYWRPTDGYGVGDIQTGWPSDSNQFAVAPWMHNYLVCGLNHAVELGYTKAAKLRNFVGSWSLTMAVSARPRLLGSFAFPSAKANATFFQSHEELFAVWAGNDVPFNAVPATSASGFPGGGAPNTSTVTVFGYGNHSAHAIAACNGDSRQAAAWAFVGPYHANTLYYNHDPREAVIPRT